MIQKIKIINNLLDNGVVAVVRGKDLDDAIGISKACLDGGLKAIELAFTTPRADQAISVLDTEFGDKILLGAGTVLDDITARIAIIAGARYIVSPNFNKSIAKVCNRYSIPYLAGCMTIAEIVEAMENGVDIVKLFPGSNFAPSFIKAVKGPIPHANIMPTGGVDLNNLATWFSNGAVAVGIGGDLTKDIQAKGYESVSQKASAYIAEFKKATSK